VIKPNRFSKLPEVVCTLLTISLLMFGTCTTAKPAQSPQGLFQAGNDLYSQGNYQKAIEVYSQIIAMDGFSGPLLYNLANCYAQIGRTGPAIVNYERALRLSPGDSDARGNLDLLRKNNGLFQEDLPLGKRAASVFDLNQWTMIAALFFVLLTVLSLAGLLFSGGGHIRLWISVLFLFFIAIASVGACSQIRQLHMAVVTTGDAHLLLSPFPAASPVGTLQEGRLVYGEVKHGQFLLIEDETGRTGWVDSNAIEFIAQPVPRR
jgi:tetratricopeptide (TPR) repeat protein